MEKKLAVGHALCLATVTVWGMTFISTKLLLKSFTPIEILFFRFILGFVALNLMYPKRMKLAARNQELLFMGAGLCGVVLYFLLENIALMYSLASNVSVIVSVAPLFTAIAAKLFLGEGKLGLGFYLGLTAAMVGVVIITLNGSAAFQLNPLGDLLALLAGLSWAAYSILLKKISALGHHTIQVTRRVFFWGLLFMLPVMVCMGFRLDLGRFRDATNLLNILFLGLGSSALGFVSWSYSVKTLGPVKSSVYIYFQPVVAVIASALILQEHITGWAVLGTALTLMGLVLCQVGLPFLRRRQKAEQIAEKSTEAD
jgi:drug/metabolite transporter (DMT)-like permease